MKNLLITGGLGYIGTSLIRHLNFEDYNSIVIIDLDLYKTENLLLSFILQENYKNKLFIKKINFCNSKELEHIYKDFRINIVMHLGGLVGDPACAFDVNLTTKINVKATNQIIDISIKYGVRKFIFASSCSVYGINDELCYETTEPRPISEYAVSKLKGEEKLQSVQEKFEEIIVFRFSTLYGVSNRVRFDLVANLFYAKARWEKEITLFGGWQWRPFINVKDAGLALSKSLDKTIYGLNIFNVGLESGNSSLENLASLIQSLYPECKVVDTGAGHDARNYKVNFDKFESEFGSILQYDLKEGIIDLYNDLREFKNDWMDIEFSNLLTTKKYSNIL